MINNMSKPGTFTCKLTEKETKKINKQLQKEMIQELMFKMKQEIKNLQSVLIFYVVLEISSF